MGPKSIPPFPDPGKPAPGPEPKPSRAESNPGEDPFVESGVPENDPEHPRATVEEESNR